MEWQSFQEKFQSNPFNAFVDLSSERCQKVLSFLENAVVPRDDPRLLAPVHPWKSEAVKKEMVRLTKQ